MTKLVWSEDKNQVLKASLDRGICFEDIAKAVDDGGLLDDVEHPNRARYPHQRMMIVRVDDYVYGVPYVKADDALFLKTAFPSRQLRKAYLTGDPHD